MTRGDAQGQLKITPCETQIKKNLHKVGKRSRHLTALKHCMDIDFINPMMIVPLVAFGIPSLSGQV